MKDIKDGLMPEGKCVCEVKNKNRKKENKEKESVGLASIPLYEGPREREDKGEGTGNRNTEKEELREVNSYISERYKIKEYNSKQSFISFAKVLF